jgi:metal-dependent amidase/aminoacylase/carboxypeptidase family protein
LIRIPDEILEELPLQIALRRDLHAHPELGFEEERTSDDFAFFAASAPGCYVWLGNGPAVDGALHHNTAWDFKDEAIASRVAFWSALVERELSASAAPRGMLG